MQDISVLYLSKVSRIPGIGQRTHTHNYWHFTLTLAGATRAEDGTPTDRTPRCDCWAAGAVNPFSVCTQTSLGYNVMFLVNSKRLSRRLEAFPFRALTEEELHIPVLTRILEQARDLNPGQDFIDFAFGYYLHLLMATCRRAGGDDPGAVTLTERALAFLEENYMRPLRLEDVAAHIGRTPSYTSFLLKRATDLTMTEHLRAIRIKNACRLLAYSSIPIPEVISACGFLSPSYFHRIFREAVGTTPDQYRTSHAVNDTFYHGKDAALDVPYAEEMFTYVPGARKRILWHTPREYLNQRVQ